MRRIIGKENLGYLFLMDLLEVRIRGGDFMTARRDCSHSLTGVELGKLEVEDSIPVLSSH